MNRKELINSVLVVRLKNTLYGDFHLAWLTA